VVIAIPGRIKRIKWGKAVVFGLQVSKLPALLLKVEPACKHFHCEHQMCGDRLARSSFHVMLAAIRTLSTEINHKGQAKHTFSFIS